MWLIIGIIALVVGSVAFWFFVMVTNRGSSGASRRDLDLMLLQLTQQLRREPNNAKLYVRRGLVRAKKGDDSGAAADLDRAIELEDDNVEARYHRGLLYQRAGDFVSAKREYKWIHDHSEAPYYKTAVSKHLHMIAKGKRQ